MRFAWVLPFLWKPVSYPRNTHRSNGTVQSAVMMDRAHPSYSAATTVTLATETCRLLVSYRRIALTCAYSLPGCFVAMLLASQSHLLPRGNYCHVRLLTTSFITLAGRPATVSAHSLNCLALGEFGSDFGRWPTVIIHSGPGARSGSFLKQHKRQRLEQNLGKGHFGIYYCLGSHSLGCRVISLPGTLIKAPLKIITIHKIALFGEEKLLSKIYKCWWRMTSSNG